jgi:hypothetical protein
VSRKKHKPKARPSPRVPNRIDIKLDEVAAIVESVKSALSPQDHTTLKAAIDALSAVSAELQKKSTSLERLRHMIFGSPSEKTRDVLGEDTGANPDTTDNADGTEKAARAKAPGHGRHGIAAYSGAQKIKIPHPSIHGGDPCPGCASGKVYPMQEPAVMVRIVGMAPLGACVYERDRLRCNLCGEVFTAPSPSGVGEEKYDATATAMVGMLKYGAGTPFNRIEKLQDGMGIPLPAGTQWDLIKNAVPSLVPIHEEHITVAAQSKVVYNDDTTMQVLQLTRQERAAALSDESSERTGVFTSGIVATGDGHKIALFFTGARHAGENLAHVLKRRAAELPPPIQMCDGLSRNIPADFETLLAQCIVHARRKYVDVADQFPDEVRFVLETLREVYKTDAAARGMTPEDRLTVHQEQSAPRMHALERWMTEQFAERKVEPNSSLGQAISYMQKRWTELTLFLREPGAPLDNNITERVLKKSILHRKNAQYFRTLNGARAGDIFMSLIHTAELNGVAPFEYLVALLRHADTVAENPRDWLPWNYTAALARLTTGAGPPE